MPTLRRRLSWMLCSWLLFQGSAIAAPLVLALAGVAVAGQELCDCPGSDHGTACPMHHAVKTAAPCAFTATHGSSDPSLLSFAGGAGVLERPIAANAPLLITQLERPAASLLRSRTELPDAPPPRA